MKTEKELAEDAKRVLDKIDENLDLLMTTKMFKDLQEFFYNPEDDWDV